MPTSDFRISLSNGHSLFAREVTNENEPNQATHQQSAFVVVILHGGPGINSYEESFEGLKKLLTLSSSPEGNTNQNQSDHSKSAPDTTIARSPCHAIRALLFYDQLGCGASDEVSAQDLDNNNISLAYYVDELEQVVRAARLRHPEPHVKICLLGHSWGGQILLEYLLQEKDDTSDTALPLCECAIISNTPLNETTYERKQQKIRQALPDDVQAFLELDDQETATVDTSGARIYRQLIGHSDTNITGSMAGWDVLERLHRLSCPCLFLTGTHDTIPFEEYRTLEAIEYSPRTHQPPQVVVLENGDHGPFYGATAPKYLSLIQSFLVHHLS